VIFKWVPLPVIIAIAIGLSGCGAGGGDSSLSTASPTTEQTLATAPSLTIRLALFGNLGSCPDAIRQRYGLYVGGEYEADAMRAFKQSNPEAKVFLYQFAGGAMEAEWARAMPNDPIGYFWILENRPEWFLVDESGNRVHDPDYPNLWRVNIDNEEYQQMWIANAIRRAKSIQADGIKIDAGNNDAFLRRAASAIHAAGLLVTVNGSCGMWNKPPWSDWLGFLDGHEYEPEGSPVMEYESIEAWENMLAGYTMFAEKIHVHYMANPQKYPEVFRFEVASFLLCMGPNSYAALPWNEGPPMYDPLLGLRIGKPTSQCAKIGVTTYRRTFEHGEVILNISGSSSESVQVGSGLRDVSTGPVTAGAVTLAPHQSLILSKG
jgi:hypothetical protein